MESEEFKYMQSKYLELKDSIRKSSTTIYDFDYNIKELYHIGCFSQGTNRSKLAQFHVCVHRELSLKRIVKTYYIADASFSNSVLAFTSHPTLNFDLILNEIQALAELSHPNIVKLFDVFFDSKYIHLVMENCKGDELYDLIYEDTINSDIALGIFIQIIEGIKFIHSKGYCHRGLCIENVMFADHERRKVKLIGFSGAIKPSGLMRTKYGSPLYMAPEVFQDCYDERCDEWSAGIILFTMVVGHQPFQSSNFKELARKVIAKKMLETEN